MEELVCVSCGKGVIGDNFVSFECPKCEKDKIIRCLVCRKNSQTYICKSCGFEGP